MLSSAITIYKLYKRLFLALVFFVHEVEGGMMPRKSVFLCLVMARQVAKFFVEGVSVVVIQ